MSSANRFIYVEGQPATLDKVVLDLVTSPIYFPAPPNAVPSADVDRSPSTGIRRHFSPVEAFPLVHR